MDIAVLTGDGIGPEIAEATVGVMEVVSAALALELDFKLYTIGLARLKTDGTTFPGAIRDAVKRADGTILGPISHSDYPSPPTEVSTSRQSFVLRWTYSLTSARADPALAYPLGPHADGSRHCPREYRRLLL